MSDGQKFWWIKVPVGFYDLDEVDWILEQANGSDYIIMYHRLCHLAINSNGKLVRTIGKMTIPYDEKKIAEKTKFSIDTVIVGLRLLENAGLIYRDNTRTYYINNFSKIVGYETKGAQRKRLQRAKNKKKLQGQKTGQYLGLNEGQQVRHEKGQARDNVPLVVPSSTKDNIGDSIKDGNRDKTWDDVPPESRSKSLDIRSKNLDKDKDLLLKQKDDSDIPFLKEELQKRKFSTNAIRVYLSAFCPETIKRQLTNFDRCEQSIEKNREGWFYKALANDYDVPISEDKRPDPNCPICHGSGKKEYRIGNTDEFVELDCTCIGGKK